MVALSRLWGPQDNPNGKVILALRRAWLVSLPISLVAWVVAMASIALSLLHRQPLVPGFIVCDLVALSLLPAILRQSLRLGLVLPRGYWTRKGSPVRRNEQPARFWFWTAAELLLLVIPTAAAGFLILVSGG